jgi:hypothetical protein
MFEGTDSMLNTESVSSNISYNQNLDITYMLSQQD